MGDGSRQCGTVTNGCKEVWKEIESRGYQVGKILADKGIASTRTILGLRTGLRKLNLLNNKHVPDIYYNASHNQRLDLLRGLMDSDGYFNRLRRRCVMQTTQIWQRDDTIKLVASLGYKPTTFLTWGSGFGKTNIPMWSVAFTPLENPFLARNQDYTEIIKNVNLTRSSFRRIKSIKEVSTVPTKCLEVDSPDKTYLVTRGYIKTHNTNKKFEIESPYKLCNGLDHLPNTEYYKYALQVSLYRYILDIDDIQQMEVIWFNNDTYQIFNMPYLKDEAEYIHNYVNSRSYSNT